MTNSLSGLPEWHASLRDPQVLWRLARSGQGDRAGDAYVVTLLQHRGRPLAQRLVALLEDPDLGARAPPPPPPPPRRRCVI